MCMVHEALKNVPCAWYMKHWKCSWIYEAAKESCYNVVSNYTSQWCFRRNYKCVSVIAFLKESVHLEMGNITFGDLDVSLYVTNECYFDCKWYDLAFDCNLDDAVCCNGSYLGIGFRWLEWYHIRRAGRNIAVLQRQSCDRKHL